MKHLNPAMHKLVDEGSTRSTRCMHQAASLGLYGMFSTRFNNYISISWCLDSCCMQHTHKMLASAADQHVHVHDCMYTCTTSPCLALMLPKLHQVRCWCYSCSNSECFIAADGNWALGYSHSYHGIATVSMLSSMRSSYYTFIKSSGLCMFCLSVSMLVLQNKPG